MRISIILKEEVPNVNGYIWPKGTLEIIAQQIRNKGNFPLHSANTSNLSSIIGFVKDPIIKDGELTVEADIRNGVFPPDMITAETCWINSVIETEILENNRLSLPKFLERLMLLDKDLMK